MDFKFEPTYLVLVAQCKLALSVVVNFFSEERSARGRCADTAPPRSARMTQNAQQLAIAAALCTFLARRTIVDRPCIVQEFNVVRFLALAAAACFLWATLACDAFQRVVALRLSPSTARVFAGLFCLAAFGVCGFVARRRLKEIDADRVANAADDSDGEDDEAAPAPAASSAGGAAALLGVGVL